MFPCEQVPLILITEPVFIPAKVAMPSSSSSIGVTSPPLLTVKPVVVDVNSVNSAEPLYNCTLHDTVPERMSPAKKP